jgi:hypothetical protein
MRSGERDLTWQEEVLVELHRQHMSTRKVIEAAKARGLRISSGQMAEAMTGKLKGGPDDRVVAAYSIVLGVHPDLLGFTRCPRTELGYLAFEAVHPDRVPREGGRLRDVA